LPTTASQVQFSQPTHAPPQPSQPSEELISTRPQPTQPFQQPSNGTQPSTQQSQHPI